MDNRFSLKKSKPKLKLVCVFSFLLLLTLIFSFSLISFDVGSTYEGVYSCQKNACTITSFFTVSEVVELKSTQRMIIDKKEQDLHIKKISDPEIMNNVAISQVIFGVTKQEFYENQTVSFFIQKEKKNIWQILWDNLKGGDVL